MARHRCPKCQRGDQLWEAVVISGYIGVDDELEPQGQPEEDGHGYDQQGFYGCACGWEGSESGLIILGTNDEPLPYILPGQLDIFQHAA